RLAMDMGADGFELDVHLSIDGDLIVMLDETVDRTTDGSGQIQSFTLKELKRLDASNGMPQYKGAKIPTLGELYDLIRDTRHLVNVEIKTDQIVYPGIAEKVLKLEQEKGMEGRILYSSFNHYTLQELRQIKPDVKYGILYSDGLFEPWKYAKSIGAAYIHPHWRTLLYPGMIEGSLAAGIGINPWTVNDEGIMELCIRHGIGVITNYPDKALAIRDTK
ncbi:MAG: glycerophosphodiester phosphodiesterase, partial [Clostridia bacterium]|nr:glycerophosphodiester phosphodiesterase [Clostridia bacterium]